MATSSGVRAAGWRGARIHLIYYNLCLLLLPLNLFSNSTALMGSDPQRRGEAARPGGLRNCGSSTGTGWPGLNPARIHLRTARCDCSCPGIILLTPQL